MYIHFNQRIAIQNPAFLEKGVRRSPFQKDSFANRESDDDGREEDP